MNLSYLNKLCDSFIYLVYAFSIPASQLTLSSSEGSKKEYLYGLSKDMCPTPT